MVFTDIRSDSVIEKLPSFMRPYLYLMRIDRPIGWWLLLLPAWWAIAISVHEADIRTFILLALFMVGAIIMRGAGCVINDIWDRELDKSVERTQNRPIASGQISVEDALIFLLLLLLCGAFILFMMPWVTIFLGIMSLPLIMIYPLMKRFTWWPQAFLGITFNFGALMGWSAVTGSLSFEPFILYVACFFWTMGYDTIYAHQDKEDDIKVGIKSTALLFGAQSQTYVYVFYGIAACLFLVVLFATPLGWGNIIGIILCFCYAGYRLSLWRPDSQNSSLGMFKENKTIGLLMFIALFL